jgi:hypothetical protein
MRMAYSVCMSKAGTARKVEHQTPEGETRFHWAITYACGHEELTDAPVHLNPVFTAKAKTDLCLKCVNKTAKKARKS